MARPIKEGLDYFPLDVDIDQDDKIALIEANHGLEGFGVVIKLLMKIYDNSYFYQWGEKEQLLFSKRVNVDINTINEIINDCLKWGLFSKELYESYEILTSKGIQRRYLEAAARRKEVKIKRQYLLLEEKEINVYKNLVIVDVNSQSEGLMSEENPQSKVKESKVKESKVEESKNSPPTTSDAIVFYQNNFGMITPYVSTEMLSWIDDVGEELVLEALKRALERNKTNWGYAKSILQSWYKKGIRSVEQAKAEEVQFINQQNTRNRKVSSYQKKEVIPDWFKNQTKPQLQQEENQPVVIDLEKEIAELNQIIESRKKARNGT